MVLKHEQKTVEFRKEEICYWHHFYFCEDTEELFETPDLVDLNLRQIYNGYRAKHRLPFADEIIAIRNKYGLSARKMSEVLGMGENQYSNYEKGEVPSLTNSRLIQLSVEPREFKRLVQLSDALTEKEREKILKKVEEAVAIEENNGWKKLEEYIVGNSNPDVFSGFRQPNIERFALMTRYFAERIKPYKVKLCKMLFYADFAHFRRTAFSISGIHYKAIGLGPVPNNFDHLFLYAEDKKYVQLEYKVFDHKDEERVGVRFLPTKESVDESVFTDSEKETLDSVILFLGKQSTEFIVELSHKEEAWLKNIKNKDFISYEYAFNLKGI